MTGPVLVRVRLQVQHLGRKMHLAFFPCRVGQAGRMTQELFRTSVGDLVSRHYKVSLAAPRDGARWHTLVFRHHKISVLAHTSFPPSQDLCGAARRDSA